MGLDFMSMANRFLKNADLSPCYSPCSIEPFGWRCNRENCLAEVRVVARQISESGRFLVSNSVRIFMRENSLEDDFEIKRQRPVFEVVQVIPQALFDRGVAT